VTADFSSWKPSRKVKRIFIKKWTDGNVKSNIKNEKIVSRIDEPAKKNGGGLKNKPRQSSRLNRHSFGH
jgi:hypothetical protein